MVAAGRGHKASFHSLAVKTDGTLWAWGHNEGEEQQDGIVWKDRPQQILSLGLEDAQQVR